jgi:hypothetical protein
MTGENHEEVVFINADLFSNSDLWIDADLS